MAFLALDLLSAEAQAGTIEQRHRHNLESFFWIWDRIAAWYDNG